MTPARIESRIRQLCCLGLGGEAVMPALLQELHGLIPSYSNTFYWVDDRYQLSNAYDEQPEATQVAPLYIEHFYNRHERSVHPGFSEVARHSRGVVRGEAFFHVTRRQLLCSDFYNLVMRPQRYHSILQLYIRDHGRTLGILQLQRKRSERDFSSADARRLARLEGYLGHALTAVAPENRGSLVENGESGLLIADQLGNLISLSPQAQHLLFLATHPRVRKGAGTDTPLQLPDPVKSICGHIGETCDDGESLQPPVYRHVNTWGGFTFRAYRLDPNSADAAHVGITINHEEPLFLRLTRGTHRFPLSRRQREIAVLLASGHTHQHIADRLTLARNTVISHSRWIYAKLDVHDVFGLRNRLLEIPTISGTTTDAAAPV